MIDPKKQAEFEQANALIGEECPALWWALFNNSIKKGFTRSEALELVKVYILSFNQGGK